MAEDFTDAELRDNTGDWKAKLTDKMERMGVVLTRQKLATAVFIRGHRSFVQAWLDEQADKNATENEREVLKEMRRQTDAARTSASGALGSMYIGIASAIISLGAAIYTAVHAVK